MSAPPAVATTALEASIAEAAQPVTTVLAVEQPSTVAPIETAAVSTQPTVSFATEAITAPVATTVAPTVSATIAETTASACAHRHDDDGHQRDDPDPINGARHGRLSAGNCDGCHVDDCGGVHRDEYCDRLCRDLKRRCCDEHAGDDVSLSTPVSTTAATVATQPATAATTTTASTSATSTTDEHSRGCGRNHECRHHREYAGYRYRSRRPQSRPRPPPRFPTALQPSWRSKRSHRLSSPTVEEPDITPPVVATTPGPSFGEVSDFVAAYQGTSACFAAVPAEMADGTVAVTAYADDANASAALADTVEQQFGNEVAIERACARPVAVRRSVISRGKRGIVAAGEPCSRRSGHHRRQLPARDDPQSRGQFRLLSSSSMTRGV